MTSIFGSVAACLLVMYSGIVTGAPEPFGLDLQLLQSGWSSISWQGDSGKFYELQVSDDLKKWVPADGFPRNGSPTPAIELFEPAQRRFFRMATTDNIMDLLYPEVIAYKSATGISLEAALEIQYFLGRLRFAGVEPALFWVGGTRYGSVQGTTIRAVIGGNGTRINGLGARGERHESLDGNQGIRFPNPLKNASQTKVGYFVGAAPAGTSGAGALISGGDFNPKGPLLLANGGHGSFKVYNPTGATIPLSNYGGFVRANDFTPYVGGVYDGKYSILCGIGKCAGNPVDPLVNSGMDPVLFPGNAFVNNKDFVDVGYPGFSGKMYFAVITAADLTDNKTAYELISIPRRSGWGSYGHKTAVVFLGDSIMNWSNEHIWNSDAWSHKAGGQWNRSCAALLGNATGDGNPQQIIYYEKGAQYALDTRTWDNLYYVCGSGGHYPVIPHFSENPLTTAAKASIDAWVNEYQTRIALPAAQRGAHVVQMTYLYGCPQRYNPPEAPEGVRTFSDYLAARQIETALSAGFTVFDAYRIPQLYAPLPAFYSDSIHPNLAGNRLIAQEFAASVANPASTAPRSLSRPVLTGSANVGATLTADSGAWEFNPLSISFQWMRDATDIPGAASALYQIQPADAGSNLSCRVTASNASGSAERTSAHSPQVGP
ncbi:MAG: SGNH/GDSL hydrolase family protein [Armatimonadetes bacterium]|nr:SGNH/GDSL hydrolase family protein [Akkermansiaceae bacterium]